MAEEKRTAPTEGPFVDAQGKQIPPDAWENDYTPRPIESFMSPEQIEAFNRETEEQKARIAALRSKQQS